MFNPEAAQKSLHESPTNPSILNKAARLVLSTSLILGGSMVSAVATETIDAHLHPANASVDDYPYSSATDCSATYGAYSWCIDSKDISPLGYGYRNCTDWTAWRVESYLGKSPKGLGNGGDWDNNAAANGYTVTSSPEPGDAAVWNPTNVSKYGHVAFVESVNSDGSVNISEYNRNLDGTYDTRNNVRADTYVDFDGVGTPLSGGGSAEQTPPMVPWVFENLEGDPNSLSRFDADTGKSPVVVDFIGSLQTFSFDATHGDLRHDWADGSGWHYETIDGAGGPNGRINADVGATPEAIVFNNTLQVLYLDRTNGNLRHAWADSSGWHFETLDGDIGSISHYDSNLGQDPSMTVFNNTLQAVYYDAGKGNLRHAWDDSSGWHFENLEGDPGSISGYNTDIGRNPKLLTYNGSLQAFYYDVGGTNLRHAWDDSYGWHFENFDGDNGSVGRLNADVGESSTALLYNNNLHAFYYDKTNGNLRHAWLDGYGWHFENLEGDPGSVSGYNSNVGLMPTAAQLGDTLQLFYYEQQGGNLRHAYANGTGWHFENLDGAGGQPAGRTTANVGYDPKAIAFGNEIQLFYYDADNGNLRHARSY